jgi:hypothetical protein
MYLTGLTVYLSFATRVIPTVGEAMSSA